MACDSTAVSSSSSFLDSLFFLLPPPLSRVQRGYDVSDYTLVSFGGAGGQHACLVADALGMRTVFIHPLAGVLSAYGMGVADVSAMKEASVEAELEGENKEEFARIVKVRKEGKTIP